MSFDGFQAIHAL